MISGPITFERTIKGIITLAVVTFLIVLIARLSDVLLPFFAAWLIAYMLNPFVDFLQYKLRFKNRTLCVIITIVLLVAIFVGGVIAFASTITEEINMVEKLINNYITGDYGYEISPETQTWANSIITSLQENKEAIAQKLLPTAYNFLSSSLEYLASLFVLFLMMLYIFFILMDFDKMQTSWQDLIPHKYREITHQIFHDLASGMNIYFRKQALISLIVGCLFAIGFKIIGLPMGIAMGLFVGVLNMVPYLHTLGMIPPIIIALVQSAQTDATFWSLLLQIIIVFCVVQVIIDMVLTPVIMGKATGLKPAVILLALSIWGSLLGVLGMIIALPVTTIILSYYKHFVVENKSSAELVEKSKINSSTNESKE